MSSYREDLAHINDTGFSDFTEAASPGLLALLRHYRVESGMVVDLGCGSGHWANVLTGAGYEVLGVDLSPAQIELAKQRAPKASFQTESLMSVAIPACDAITAIGEIVNYQFDSTQTRSALSRLFRRAYKALRPGGLLIFDVAGPDRVPKTVPALFWKEALDWSIFVDVDGNAQARWMTRRIVCFRRNADGFFRRSEELHRMRLHHPEDILAELKSIGFIARVTDRYGSFRLYPGMHAIIARKPRTSLSPETTLRTQ